MSVDSDMSVGPQFRPLVEMKEKNELSDTEDDGSDGGEVGGEVGGGGGGGDGVEVGGGDGGEVGGGDSVEVGGGDGDRDDVGDRGTRGQKKKRKAPKQKKKAPAKKQRRETVPITRLTEEDPLRSPYSPTQLDDPLSVGFTPGYTPTLPKGMVRSPYPPRSSFMQPPPHMSSRQEPQSRVSRVECSFLFIYFMFSFNYFFNLLTCIPYSINGNFRMVTG